MTRRRRWFGALTVTPALLLPVAAALLSAILLPPEEGGTRLPADDLGVSGRVPDEPHISPKLRGQAAHPRELATGAGAPIEVPEGPLGIPEPMLDAYSAAADRLAESRPGCGVHWSVLASIGRIESGHARSGNVDARGTTVSAILGPRLNGSPEVAAIPDTDAGALDGDPVWDRAVGSMQFIPSTWWKYAADGNDDGVASPHNVHDATVAAGEYLCSGGADLRDSRNVASAVFRYNQSDSYVRTVLVWAAAYARGATPTPGELADEVEQDDVLAGQRLPDEPAVVLVPDQADVTSPGPEPPGSPVPPSSPVPPAVFPPGTPPESTSEPAAPPSTVLPPATTPPSSTPPSSTPPSSTPPSTEPPSSVAPPSGEPPSGGTTLSADVPPEAARPPETAPRAAPSPPVCSPEKISTGEFVTEDGRSTASADLPRATTDPAAAAPGVVVYVEPEASGPLEPCAVAAQ